MKKQHIKPAIRIIMIQQSQFICQSRVTSVRGGVFSETVSGGSGDARSRDFDGCGDEDF
jgi:hypothetical protein